MTPHGLSFSAQPKKRYAESGRAQESSLRRYSGETGVRDGGCEHGSGFDGKRRCLGRCLVSNVCNGRILAVFPSRAAIFMLITISNKYPTTNQPHPPPQIHHTQPTCFHPNSIPASATNSFHLMNKHLASDRFRSHCPMATSLRKEAAYIPQFLQSGVCTNAISF